MVKKIFKREFTRSAKILIILSSITLGLSVASAALSKLAETSDGNVFVVIFSTLLSGAFGSGISAVSAVETVIVFSGTYKAFATDEAYLTFTLPVSVKDHVKARYLSCLLWTFIIGAVNALSTAITLLFGYSGIYEGFSEVFSFGAAEIIAGAEIVLLVLCSVFFVVSQIFFAIIFGMTNAKKRKLGAIILTLIAMYVIEGFAVSVFVALSSVFVAVFVGAGSAMIATDVVLGIIIIAVAGLSALFYEISCNILNKRLNVD